LGCYIILVVGKPLWFVGISIVSGGYSLMARPLRIEWPGALYHLTDRGNERQAIFRDDRDRQYLLQCFEDAVERFGLLSA